MKVNKYLLLFFYDIILYYNEFLILQDDFEDIFISFIKSYYPSNKNIFNKMLGLPKDQDISLIDSFIYLDQYQILSMLLPYLNYEKQILKLLDDLGYQEVKKINDLITLFIEYINYLTDSNRLVIKQ